MNQIEKMFSHKGKSSKLIGDNRSKIYHEVYNHLTEKQKSKELQYNGNYLADNELAKNIELQQGKMFQLIFIMKVV